MRNQKLVLQKENRKSKPEVSFTFKFYYLKIDHYRFPTVYKVKGETIQIMSTQQFEEKYYKYKDLLFRIIFTYVKNPNDAEDILQEVFTKLYCSNKAFETDEHEKRWLIRISINLSKNHLKLFWNKKRDIFNHEDLPGESFSSEYNDLLQMVLNLPDKCKAPMYLHYYEGYSCKQIGEILGCKESAIKMRLKRGRELLKMNLEEDKQYGC